MTYFSNSIRNFFRGFFSKKICFLVAFLYFCYFIAARFNPLDWDLWARLAVGSIFFQTGGVLKSDPFAYTLTKELWIDHEWGSGVIFYYLSHYFGDAGLIFLKTAILIGIVVFVFNTAQSHKDDAKKDQHKDPFRPFYYILMLYAILPAFATVLRSHSFTYLFFALWLYLLELIRQGKARLLIYLCFILSMLIWANVHGGFLAGLGIVFVYGIGDFFETGRWKEYFIILISCLLITLINPYGIDYWHFLIDAITLNRPYVQEWWPLNFFGAIQQLLGFKIIFIATLLSISYTFIKQKEKIRWGELLVLLVTAYLAFRHVRHIIFFIIAASSYIYYSLYPALDWISGSILERFYNLFNKKNRIFSKKLRDVSFYALVFIFAIIISASLPPKTTVPSARYPTGAVKFIQTNELKGNLLVLFNWGSYALWKLYPQCKISVDGRYEEVYPEETMNDIINFHYQKKNWDDILKKYNTDLILVPASYKKLNARLMSLAEWTMIYKDRISVIYIPSASKKTKYYAVSDNFDPNTEKFDSLINKVFGKSH